MNVVKIGNMEFDLDNKHKYKYLPIEETGTMFDCVDIEQYLTKPMIKLIKRSKNDISEKEIGYIVEVLKSRYWLEHNGFNTELPRDVMGDIDWERAMYEYDWEPKPNTDNPIDDPKWVDWYSRHPETWAEWSGTFVYTQLIRTGVMKPAVPPMWRRTQSLLEASVAQTDWKLTEEHRKSMRGEE